MYPLPENASFVSNAAEVDNFPGFPDGITGPQLMANMREQGARWGAVYETEDVEHVDFSSRPFTIQSSSREVKAQTVIIATGEGVHVNSLGVGAIRGE